MTLQNSDQNGLRRVMKTTYQNQFQVIGFQPWLSPNKFQTLAEAKAELSKMSFNENMTVTTLVNRVIVREQKH